MVLDIGFCYGYQMQPGAKYTVPSRKSEWRNIALAMALLLCLVAAPSGAAEISGSQAAKEAFQFAVKGNWSEAFLFARRSGDPLVAKTVQWLYCRTKDSGADFEDITRFAGHNPDWPDSDVLMQRAEGSLASGKYDDPAVVTWFTRHPPATGIGKITFAQIVARHYKGEKKRIELLVREGWVQGDFPRPMETAVLVQFGRLLRVQDHADRANRLLWEGHDDAAQRLVPYLPARLRHIIEARVALMEGARKAPALVNALPRSDQLEPGVLYERIRWRAGHDGTGIEELLALAPQDVPYPQKWWKYRESAVRAALAARRYRAAYALMKNHGQREGPERLDALFLAGWIGLEFARDPYGAYEQFYALHREGRTPVSKARGAYWAGRAAETNGNIDIAHNWYAEASRYGTAFYGQLAQAKLSKPSLNLPPAPHFTPEEKRQFRGEELPRAVLMLSEAHADDWAHRFLVHLVEHAANARETALAADLALATHRKEEGVKIAKRGQQQKGAALLEAGYPTLGFMPELVPVEKSLVHAIVRQESEFDPRVVSPSGAAGLMQLLPATAEEVARRNRLGFSRDRLFEPHYNVTLGGLYLGKLVNQFDGSYVKAIAAYNGGPGNVRKWEGEPPKDVEGALDWVESIPFSETRNYVLRVLENLQVYRARFDRKSGLKIEQDLLR